MSKRFAVVSIGTNSVRLLLADVEPDEPRVETARWAGTRVGEGLDERGRLDENAMQRTLEAVADLRKSVRGHYVRLFAIATSALRRAENADDFAQRVQATLGVPLRIISGEEEAAASYRGALTAFGRLRGEMVGVCDVGGGSTEYAVGSKPEPEKTVSCEIGAVRLTEAVPELSGGDGAVQDGSVEKARELARKALEPLKECGQIERLAFVGGSATTAGAIVRAKASMQTYPLTRADLERLLQQLLKMPLEERKKVPGMIAQRADILPAGIIVMDGVMEITGRPDAIATRNDLLLGYALQERDALPARAAAPERFAHRSSQ